MMRRPTEYLQELQQPQRRPSVRPQHMGMRSARMHLHENALERAAFANAVTALPAQGDNTTGSQCARVPADKQ
jgi:hypothetical protein